MATNKIYEFIRDNREKLVEALENHISETESLREAADDERYMVDTDKRNRLLKRLVNVIKNHSYQQSTNPSGK